MTKDIFDGFLLTGASGMVAFFVNWIVQSTSVLAAGLLIGAALRRHGSAVQSAVYRTALVAMLMAPLVTGLLSGAGLTGWSLSVGAAPGDTAGSSTVFETSVQRPLPAASMERQMRSEAMAGEVAVVGRTAPPGPFDEPHSSAFTARRASPEQTSAAPAAASSRGWLAALPLLWVALSMLLLIRLGRAMHALARFRRLSVAADAASIELLRRLADRFGVSPPELLRSPLIASPCLSGVRRPVILLPEEPMPLPLRDVLLHELAHLRRRDCLWNLLTQVATAVFFFQPLLWLLARRMEAAAEEVCDDYVVEFGADPRAYASRLVEVAEQSLVPMNPAGVGIVRVRSMLERRVRRILDTSRARSIKLGRVLCLVIISGGVSATLLAGLVGGTEGAPNAEATSSGDPPVTAEAKEVLRGTVRNAEGEPLADVPVYLIAYIERWDPVNRISSVPETAGSGRTDSNGAFELRVEPNRPHIQAYQIVAVPPGHGIVPGPRLVDLPDALKQTHEIIATEALPIAGEILSPQGEPVAGAKVRVARIVSRDSAEEWRGIGVLLYGLHWLDAPFEFWPAPVETDADGQFHLFAAGAEGLVTLVIEAEGFAPAKLDVASADMVAALNERRSSPRPEKDDEIFEPGFTYVLEPSRIFEGTVADARSGRTLPGVEIVLRSANHGPIDWNLTTITDADGKFRVEAAVARWIYTIGAQAEGYIGYFENIAADSVEATLEEFAVMRHDIALTPAVEVHGRVVGEAGGGIAGAAVMYHPDDENPAEMQSHSFWNRVVLTDDQGEFVISTLPGQGYILAEINSEEYVRTGFPLYSGDTYPHGDAFPHGLIEIDAPDEREWKAPPIVLQKGGAIEVRVVGPNGEAVEKLNVASLESSGTMTDANLVSNRSPYRNGRHRLVGLSDVQAYRTFFYSPDLNAGATADLKYDPERSEPRVVRLQPAATVRGRLVYEDGAPARKISVSPKFVITDEDPDEVDFWSSRVAYLANVTHPTPANLVTDANGEFERTGFFPGAYSLISLNQEFADGARHHRIGRLEPGELRDLGTLEIKRKE